MFYAIYFFQKYPNINKIKISYVYVEHADTENDLILERKYLDTYVSELINLINDAENDMEYAKNPSMLCSYCPFEVHCKQDV